MITLRQLVAITSEALGVNSTPYARRLIEDGYLVGWKYESAPWDAAVIVGAILASPTASRAGDALIALHGIPVWTASQITGSGPLDMRDWWSAQYASPIDLLEGLFAPTTVAQIESLQVAEGGERASVLIESAAGTYVAIYSDGDAGAARLRRVGEIGEAAISQIRAAFGPAPVVEPAVVPSPPPSLGNWGLIYPTSASVH